MARPIKRKSLESASAARRSGQELRKQLIAARAVDVMVAVGPTCRPGSDGLYSARICS